jgi:RNA polymerase sigma factor (sigma-70 family)
MAQLDPDVLEAACRGDAAALDALLAAVQPDLRRMARHRCSTSEDADDAVQMALWRLQRSIGTLRALPALAAWMFRIVERECFRLFRSLRGNTELTESIEATLYAAPVPVQLRHDLVKAIRALPAMYREVLVLRDIDELSGPETARRLDIPVATVKMRLHRARALVRAALIEGDYLSADAPLD